MSHSSRRITCVFDINQPKSTQYESKVQFDENYRLVPIGRSISDWSIEIDRLVSIEYIWWNFYREFFTTEDHFLEKWQTYREISILDIDYWVIGPLDFDIKYHFES